ncbi:MAG: hypothetical protein ACK4IK_03600 [Bacteroidia bacterium]
MENVENQIINKLKEAFQLINDKYFEKLELFYNNLIKDTVFKKNIINVKDIGFKITEDDVKKINLFYDELKDNTQSVYGYDNWSALEKLFFSVLWKNNQISRFELLIKGLNNYDNKEKNREEDYESVKVFEQFGKHLRVPESIPIVDQHVLRAFWLHKLIKDNEITNIDDIQKNLNDNILAFDAITNPTSKKKKEIFDEVFKEYLKWFESLEINSNQHNRLIDKTLFVLGKTIYKSFIKK